MLLTIISTVLSLVLLFIFGMVYREIVKQPVQSGKSITIFIIIAQLIILAEILLSYFNII